MRKYELIIEDLNWQRDPKSIKETYQVEADTASDAITIGQVKYNFPRSDSFYNRRLVDIRPVVNQHDIWAQFKTRMMMIVNQQQASLDASGIKMDSDKGKISFQCKRS